MGVEPPFIYDPPSRYSFIGPTERGFNPKAVTEKTWVPPAPKAKSNGPLINFNQHPDSYLVVPYGNLNATPLSPNTKSKVKYSRLVQLGLRVLALIGALGILFCVIAIKGTSGSLGWIIRVAPGVAILHTVYAVYHLCRSPTGRTPGSTGSYMVFAAMIDAGLLPFLAFSAFMAHNEHTTGAYGWDTLFGVPLATWYIVYSTFLLCVIEGGLLLVSLMLGIYLSILFRKIAKLPPDMNPLEPNLTARPHKRNKSELTTSDKHVSQTSLVSHKRMSSTAEPLIAPGRRVPFMHTRADSADKMPLYHNDSARSSLLDAPRPENLYRQSNHSHRGSYTPVNKSLPSPPSRPQSAMAPSISSRKAGVGLDHRPTRSSQLAQDGENNPWLTTITANPNRQVSPLETYHHQTTTPRQHSPARPTNDENISPISSRASTPDPDPDPDRANTYVEIKNWYESPHSNKKGSQEDLLPIQQPQWQQQQPHSPYSTSASASASPTRAQPAHRPHQQSRYDFDRDHHLLLSPTEKEYPQNPLGMNPPSPAFSESQQPHHQPHQQQQHNNNNNNNRLQNERDSGEAEEPTKRYALHDAPVNLPPPRRRPNGASSRPSSFVGSGSKGRYYGSLRSPVVVGGSLGGKGGENDGDTASSEYSKEENDCGYEEEEKEEGAGGRTVTMDSHIEIWGGDDEEEEEEEGDENVQVFDIGGGGGGGGGDIGGGYVDQQGMEQDDELEEVDRKGRVVSQTGVDLSSGYAGLGVEFGRGMGRRREVSGKVVEEGRAGRGGGGMERYGGGEAGYPGPGGLLAGGAQDRVAELMGGRVAGGVGKGGANGNGNGNGDVKANVKASRTGLGAAGWARFKGL